jgi:parallel beta-helix repeat protein
MLKRIVTNVMLVLLVTSILVLAVKIPPVQASGTIYIRADGSVDPPTAPIHRDGDTYTFTDNINDSIVVERDNIVIDGAGYTVQGPGASWPMGIELLGKDVMVKNTQIHNFDYGIVFSSSSSNISGNNITNNSNGIWLDVSTSNNIVSGNNIADNSNGIMLDVSSNNNSVSGNNIANNECGIYLASSSNNNSVSGNNITNNECGIYLASSSGNSISGNTFTDDGLVVQDSYQNSVEDNTVNGKSLVYLEGVANYSVGDAGQVVLVRCDSIRVENLNLSRASVGVELWETNNTIISRNNITNNSNGIYLDSSSNNKIYHNSFINNMSQVSSYWSMNVWDDGYPSGGNYWSDYTGLDLYKGPYQNETGSDGIEDTFYPPPVIAADYRDHYPVMKPYPWGPHDAGVTYIGKCYEIGIGILIDPPRTVAGLNILLHLDVFVMNYGDYPEVLNLTLYANSTIVSQVSNVTLSAKNSTILDVLWDTSGFEMGNYAISAYLKPVPGDSDVKDNNYTEGWIKITIPGDIDGNGIVQLNDLVLLAMHYGSKPPSNPDTDIDDNGAVGLSDLVALAQHYGQHYP